jgi:hypothetical protein
MSRSRHLLSLSIATLCVLMLAAVSWCGGPVDAVSRGAGAPNFGDGGFGDSGGAANGLSMSASGGLSSGNGVDSQSPWINFDSLNMHNGYSYGVRASYIPVGFASNFRIIGDWTKAHLSGSGTYPLGSFPHPVLVPGMEAGGTLDINLLTVNVDYDLSSFLSYSAMKFGPRVQYLNYSDSFFLWGPVASDTANKAYGMFGVGAFGIINFGKLAGLGMGGYSPTLSFACALGGSKSMWNTSWEVFLSVFNTSSASFLSSMPLTVTAEVGYTNYNFKYKEDTVQGILLPSPPGGAITNDMKYQLGVPFIRGTVVF